MISIIEKSDEEQPIKMSVLKAYRLGKISQAVYQKWVADGYNVKTTQIEVH